MSTVGYEYVIYLYGTIKAAALFGTVNTKLAHYVSIQGWSGATIAENAMEKLVESTLTEPTLPSPTEEYEVRKTRKSLILTTRDKS